MAFFLVTSLTVSICIASFEAIGELHAEDYVGHMSQVKLAYLTEISGKFPNYQKLWEN